jgi:hypothetical protein
VADLTKVLRSGLWTKRTWKQYASLWNRFSQYTAFRALSMSDRTAAFLTNDKNVCSSTKMAYARQRGGPYEKEGAAQRGFASVSPHATGAGGNALRCRSPPILKEMRIEAANGHELRTLTHRDAARLKYCGPMERHLTVGEEAICPCFSS